VTCPVSGDAIDAAVSVEHDGNPVFFCCRECLSKFQADPDAYRGKLAASYTYQTKCPVTGKPIDPGVSFTMPEGERAYFCSEACKATFRRDPASYAAKLAEQGLKIHL
jgi:Cu+-exporting ATPase